MAGNPFLLSLQSMAEQGWIDETVMRGAPEFPQGRVDFGALIPFKWRVLKSAARTFFQDRASPRRSEFEDFRFHHREWLDGFAQFMALKDANQGVAWPHWKQRSDPDPEEVLAHKFIQFEFFRQWGALKRYANERGILIIGDLPIFVAHDSADVWANKILFDLQRDGSPRTIAGVPPDYFSATGQRWGNPLYRWDVMAATGYRWWIERMRATLETVDIVRLDHFRGFEKYYEIPGTAATAETGRWVEGPGSNLFVALEKALGKLPVIAEDLGFITPEVEALREHWGFPGMRVLQFAFGDELGSDSFKPHNYVRNSVVYTGTHDNDTTVGWFTGLNSGQSTLTAEQVKTERDFALRYLNTDGSEIHWDFIRAALASVANLAIIPMQDLLGLGSEARMNLPASSGNNWTWRFRESDLKPELASRLRRLALLYGRASEPIAV
jgi:4-alpha-glucanotransferase